MRCPHSPRNLYEIDTRAWVRELGVARLRDVPDEALDRLAALGFSWVWLMGVWTPSSYAERLARQHADEYRRALPDLVVDADVVASPYAVGAYEVSSRLGGPGDLASLRARLATRGLRLLLDFVPNHTACDHRFVLTQPEMYVGATASASTRDTFGTPDGRRLFHGRDPHFPAWTDTAQVDVRRASTRHALIEELRSVARQCDGVRCDMAMLLLSDVFARTWSRPDALQPAQSDAARGEFWAEAIDRVRADQPEFVFLAEAYWGTERRLHQLGFDYTYDKSLYDRLGEGRADEVRAHLAEGRARHRRAVRFLENHDEERAAARFANDMHRVAALLSMTLPGVRLFQHGQLEGARHRVPVQVTRRPEEPVDEALASFYEALLEALADPVLLSGDWRSLLPEQAWPHNPTHLAFVAYGWDGSLLGDHRHGHRLLVANLAAHPAQCRLPMALPGLAGRRVALREVLASGRTPVGEGCDASGRPVYHRDGDEMTASGLFVDLPPRTAQLLRVEILRDRVSGCTETLRWGDPDIIR